MRTIGVLGGIGPQATMDFEAGLHAASEKLIPRRANTGYPPLVTVYLRHPPIRVGADGKPLDPLELDPRVLETARRLGEWADVLVIPSNTPHLFLDAIAEAAGCDVLSIVDVTVDAIRKHRADTVGLIGLGLTEVYMRRFAAEGWTILTAPEDVRQRLDDAILRVMEGRDDASDRDAAAAAMTAVREAGARITVLGCTEIPLLLGDRSQAPDLVNPAELLAEAAVRAALSA